MVALVQKYWNVVDECIAVAFIGQCVTEFEPSNIVFSVALSVFGFEKSKIILWWSVLTLLQYNEAKRKK